MISTTIFGFWAAPGGHRRHYCLVPRWPRNAQGTRQGGHCQPTERVRWVAAPSATAPGPGGIRRAQRPAGCRPTPGSRPAEVQGPGYPTSGTGAPHTRVAAQECAPRSERDRDRAASLGLQARV